MSLYFYYIGRFFADMQQDVFDYTTISVVEIKTSMIDNPEATLHKIFTNLNKSLENFFCRLDINRENFNKVLITEGIFVVLEKHILMY